jgi:hypothetical protein
MEDTVKDENHLAIALAISEWLEQESVYLRDVAATLEITPNRALAALMGLDWNPTMRHIAKIEAAIGEDVFEVNLNDKPNT